jgi:nucleolar protein 4
LIRKDDKFSGFGFVTFEKKTDAAKAIEILNNKEFKLLGTNVIADWCLPKDLYLKNQRDMPEEKSKNDKEDKSVKEESNSEHNSDEGEAEEDLDNNESDGEKDEEDEKEEEEEDKKEKKIVSEKHKIKQKAGTKDVLEKRTVFLRNLSFDATEDQLREVFSKYGQVKYCKLCMDRDLERPRGTGFIQFEEAQSALDACAESNILEIDSRRIQIDLAMSRTNVDELVKEKKTKEPRDNRNLALAKEGVIYPNSYEAKELSKSDLDKRAKIEAANTAKLKILHYFVSPTRLSVHNIPVKTTDEELRKIFSNALGDMKGKKILECRIMRDLTRLNADGVAKSRGYGFVEFANYEQAHKALHATNNNPDIFEDKKTRLIVQFSIEDIRKLKIKERRLEKQKAKKGLPITKKQSKLRNRKLHKNVNDHDYDPSIDDVNKIKEKNLMRVHNIEKKLSKRKMEEEKKKNAKKVRTESTKKQIPTTTANPDKKKRKKQVRKQRPKKVIKDDTDDLIDKYMQNKSTKKRKWFE